MIHKVSLSSDGVSESCQEKDQRREGNRKKKERKKNLSSCQIF